MSDLPPLRRNFRFQMLWIGASASELGSTLTWLAFPLLVLAVTGSAALAGLTGACRIATNLLVSLPAGVWVDRWDRRRILIASEATRFVSLAALAVAIWADQVALWQIVVVAVVNGAADAFFSPARSIAIRAVVPAAQLSSAYAQEEARSHAASLAGPPLGGFLFGLGRVFPFVVDALTYLISMLCIIAARVPRRPESSGEPGDQPRRAGMRADIAEAAGWLWRRHGLRAALALSLVANLTANALLIPVIVLIESRGGDPATTGFVLAGLGLGGLLGATVAARISRLLPAGPLMLAVVGFFALAVCATTLPLGPYWPVVPLALAMVAAPALNVAIRVLVATLVPDALMGRLQSLFTVASMGLAPVGPLLGGVLGQYTGGAGALLIIGGMMAVSCLFAAAGPNLRGLDIPVTAAEPDPKAPTGTEQATEQATERDTQRDAQRDTTKETAANGVEPCADSGSDAAGRPVELGRESVSER